MEMKYVRHSTVGFITWPMRLGDVGNLFHSMVGRMLACHPETFGNIESAGFFEVNKGKVRCYGMSESLGVKSAPGDSKRLAAQLGLTADPAGV